MIHIGLTAEAEIVEIPVFHTSVFGLGYLIGFLEGEGGFLLYKGKGSKQLTPVVSIYNTDRTPLEFIQTILGDNGIKSAIYHNDPKPDKRAAWVNVKRKRCYTLRVCYRQNCLPLMRLLDGKIIAQGKQEQFRLWKEAMLSREKEIAASREQVRSRNELVMRRVAAGESPISIAKEFGLKRSSLYVMLHRRGVSVSKLQGGANL